MKITVRWPDGYSDSAPTWRELEDQIRREQWTTYTRHQFRHEMRDRARLWSGLDRRVRVHSTSRRFIESLAAAGMFTLEVIS